MLIMLPFKIQPNHFVNVHYLLHVSYTVHGPRRIYGIWSRKDSQDHGWFTTQVNKQKVPRHHDHLQ